MRILALLPDGFGGRGGIACYNRDLVTALSCHPRVSEIVILQRVSLEVPRAVPAKVKLVRESEVGKVGFFLALMRTLSANRNFDVVLCGHLNLLAFSSLAKRWTGGELWVELYGLEAWGPRGRVSSDSMLRNVDRWVSISHITAERFSRWSGISRSKVRILPNAVHLEHYSAGPKDAVSLQKHDLTNQKVIMTMGRLVGRDRYKGFDEVLECLPRLRDAEPDIRYLIVGDGHDRNRLEQKAKALGVENHVVFTGYIADEDKSRYFSLADTYVMPSYGEGFGFVVLEALACGVPVVASRADGTSEALAQGRFGELVSPRDQPSLELAILKALRKPKAVPEGLEEFSFERFVQRAHQIVDAS